MSSWDALDAAARETKLSLPRLEDLQWCVAPPGVVLRLRTSGGESRTVRVPMRQFHQLRYSAAKVRSAEVVGVLGAAHEQRT